MRIRVDHRPNAEFLSELLAVPLLIKTVPAQKAEKSRKKASKTSPWAALEEGSVRILQRIDRATGGELKARIESDRFRFEAGKRLEVPLSPRLLEGVKGGKTRLIKIYLIGMTDASQRSGRDVEQTWRIIGGDLGQTMRSGSFSTTAILSPALGGMQTESDMRFAALVEGFMLGRYQFTEYKSRAKSAKGEKRGEPALTVVAEKKPSKNASTALLSAGAAAERRASAVIFCRDLVNRPPSDLHPVDLLKAAKKASSRRGSRISLKSFGRARLKAMGANGILTVARGSGIEPFLIHATYKPARKNRAAKRIVLVGKGVTFDSGGLSIKTGKGMEDMKCDMAGAAAVISVLKAIADAPERERPIHEIHVLVPTVENLINENSVKPGDVFFALNGKSVEVLNTDAEGRLILADALSYAARLKPDLIVDLATLTGACVAALGSDYAGLFATDRRLENELVETGKKAGELVWPLPLAKEYRPLISSSVADIQNIGPGGPGAITAALFLQEFVPPKVPWAHLDIAGPAFVTKGTEIIRPGGTGFGVRLLLKLVHESSLPLAAPA